MNFDLLNDIEEIKEKITDNQYKTILDKLMKINTHTNELKNQYELLQKLHNRLTNDYIKMSKFMLTLSLEREGLNYDSVIIDIGGNDVNQLYQEFLSQNP